MQYMILALETVDDFDARSDPDRTGEYWAAWSGYIAALTEHGILSSAGGLQPPHTATTISVRNDRLTVHDGPYADSKEQLGGYFVIEVDYLDAALEWAAKCPSVQSARVEVRPLLAASPAM